MSSFSSSRRSILACLPLALLPALWSGPAAAGAYDDFFKAIRFDDVKRVRELMARGLGPNVVEESRGESAVMVAIREGSQQAFRLLVQHPDFDPELRAKNGDTALMLAAFTGRLDMARALLELDAEVNREGWTALHYAAASGSNDIVQLLLDKDAYIDTASPNGTTPIMMAAGTGHILTVKLLLDQGADVTLKNERGLNAIDFARLGGYQDIVDGLTSRLKKMGKL